MGNGSSSEANDPSVFRKDVVSVFDFVERLENGVDVDQIQTLKAGLAFICIYSQFSHSILEDFEAIMDETRQLVKELIASINVNVWIKYNMLHIRTRLTDNIDDYIRSSHRSESSAAMTEEQLDFLLQNLHHLSKFCAEQVSPLVSEYRILHNVCSNIKDFHGLIVNGCIEHEIVENVLPQFQHMAERVGLFLWEDRRGGDSQLFKLAHLFLKVIPIELEIIQICFTNLQASTSAEVRRFIVQLLEMSPDILREYLIHLQEHMINIITPSTSGARSVHVMIEFLLITVTDMPKDFIHREKLFDLLAHVGTLTSKISILVCNLEEEKSRKEESSNEINCAALDLLENIELLKENLKHVYLKTPVGSSQLRFPASDGPLFMYFLLGHLKGLLSSNAYSVDLIKKEIELVMKGLEPVRSFFVNVEQHQLYKDLRARILDVSYETKDVIDSIMVRDNGLVHLIFSLPIAIEKIKLLKEDIKHQASQRRDLIVANSPNKQPIERKSLINDKMFVGFKEETGWMIRNLTHGPAQLDVISIIGMPGLGKTTLAYNVYDDKSVSSHFDIRAWCTVGQEQDKKKLMKNIFNQVIGSDAKVCENIDDVADKVRKHLFGKRYLIVLDDLWDTDTWDELTRAFPKVEKGSRIILTTREERVSLHAKHCCDSLYLRFLRLEEVWELVEKRIFGEENPCPNELLDVGKEIAKSCKGLPLVADLIVGVLKMKKKERTVWLEVRNNLSSFTFKNEVDVMKVIELSYDHLADHLKLCLLYFASWVKDTEHSVDWLKGYWCAEGLVEETEMKSVEEVAEGYLDNLVSSSLVISFSEIRDYRIIQIHDLVHDFCSIKAKEENLIDLISSSAPSYSSDLMPRKMRINYDKELFVLHPELRNNFVLFGSRNKKDSREHLYSLDIAGDEVDKRLYDRCHLRHLRLLRVLSLYPSFIKVKDPLLNEICTLVHLRFLNIEIEVKSLPLSFSTLWNLEILYLENKGSPMVLLPTIWNLVKLRELSIYYCSLFDLDTDKSMLMVENSKLENLRVFWGLQVSYSTETGDIFERFPNLQQLGFLLMESWDCSTEKYWFPKLDFLNELEFLSIIFRSSNSNNRVPGSVSATNLWDFIFPWSLKTLLLYGFPLTSDSLSTMARLPNLERLDLVKAIIHGEEWNMGEEDTFENLKRLTLDEPNLAKWKIGEECFAKLERLILNSCHKLEAVPPTFGDIDSLKSIKLVKCPHLVESAVKIKEDVEELTGNDKLRVLCLNE